MSGAERREALLVAAERSARPPHLLEKDIWVVWALRHLFTGAQAEHLVFKGGTSLSKAWGVIRRFSEDVDLTYDVRTIAPELIESGELVWPRTKSQRKKWADTIRGRLTDGASNGEFKRRVGHLRGLGRLDRRQLSSGSTLERTSTVKMRRSLAWLCDGLCRCIAAQADGDPNKHASREAEAA
jgi:hypothetical protein